MYIFKRIFQFLITAIITIVVVTLLITNIDAPATNMIKNFVDKTGASNVMYEVTNPIVDAFEKGVEQLKDIFSFNFESLHKNNQSQTEEDSKLEAYEVDYIIDGDTFFVRTSKGRMKVRLIGVDTPESVASDEYTAKTGKKNTTEGKQASEFTTKTLSGATVWLEYDEEKTDTYGRTLAYVYLDANKETMLQELLLNNGMARCMEIEPNTKYASHFSKLEATAKANGTGFWSTEVWNEQ